MTQLCLPSAGSASAAAGNGSGDGDGSLAGLLNRLEFVYTDISPQLVAYGRKTYGPEFPFARFRLLDVERDVEAQVGTYPASVSFFASMHHRD